MTTISKYDVGHLEFISINLAEGREMPIMWQPGQCTNHLIEYMKKDSLQYLHSWSNICKVAAIYGKLESSRTNTCWSIFSVGVGWCWK